MKKEGGHLPLYGPGPAYTVTIIALTVAGIVLSALGIIPGTDPGAASIPLKIIGTAFVIGGVALWVSAVFGSRIDDNIEANRLVTDGVYAVVRNPIYSAFTLVCAGALLLFGNLWLLVLLPVFWAFLTILMKATEEKWLLELYGQEYVDYCSRVNRCIPWFPRK